MAGIKRVNHGWAWLWMLVLAAVLIAGSPAEIAADDSVAIPPPMEIPQDETPPEAADAREVQHLRETVDSIQRSWLRFFWRVDYYWSTFMHIQPAVLQELDKQVQRCC